jgi:hypothetical protein
VGATASRSFTAVLEPDARGRVVIALPFDPAREWGPRPRYHVAGTVGESRVRGPLTGEGTGARLVLGSAWCRDFGIVVGEPVRVELWPEGPQREELAPDVTAALDARPEARAFFDGLATFYRKGYLTWVNGTKRRPEVRAARIAEMVELLAAGRKQRPSTPSAGGARQE